MRKGKKTISTTCVVVLDSSDNFLTFSEDKFQAILKGHVPLRILAGETARCAIVTVPFSQEELGQYTQAKYCFLRFNENGVIDQAFLSALEKGATGSALSLDLPGRFSNVIDATAFFSQRRYENEYLWTPSLELENALVESATKYILENGDPTDVSTNETKLDGSTRRRRS